MKYVQFKASQTKYEVDQINIEIKDGIEFFHIIYTDGSYDLRDAIEVHEFKAW